MSITINELKSYMSLCAEQTEIENRISRLEQRIYKLNKRLLEIENNEVVKDRVYGGYGGNQGFNIEGVPIAEYSRKRTLLLIDKESLEYQKQALSQCSVKVTQQKTGVERFLLTIDDSEIRRIIRLRFIDKKAWDEVAFALDTTPDAARKQFERWFARATGEDSGKKDEKRHKK